MTDAFNDKMVRLWDTATGDMLAKFNSRILGMGRNIALSLDGSRLAIGCKDDAIRVWDTMTKKRIQKYKCQRSTGTMTFTRDGKRLAWFEFSRRIKLGDIATGETHEVDAFNQYVDKFSFSSDETCLYTNRGELPLSEINTHDRLFAGEKWITVGQNRILAIPVSIALCVNGNLVAYGDRKDVVIVRF